MQAFHNTNSRRAVSLFGAVLSVFSGAYDVLRYFPEMTEKQIFVALIISGVLVYFMIRVSIEGLLSVSGLA